MLRFVPRYAKDAHGGCTLQAHEDIGPLGCSRQPAIVPQHLTRHGTHMLLQGDTMEDVILDVLGPALYTLSFAYSSLLLVVEAAAPFQVPCLTYWDASCLLLCL
jgi:hypothetical protein